MKRSDMLLKLQECMIEAPSDVVEASDYILKRLEKYGMLPPEILKVDGIDRWYSHEWEPNDDL